MGGGDLNTKKSWHPNTMKNQERVWKAEQAAAEEKKRIQELQREREEENDRAQLKEMAQRNYGASGSAENRLHWMYDNKPDRQTQQEDYLLGKAIGKNDGEDSQQNTIPAVSRRVVGSSMLTTGDDSQVDLARKLREDPLLLVKERERAARAALLNNPLQRKKLTELLRKEQEQTEMKSKKKSKKKDLDDVLAAKLNALGGKKGIDLTSLLNSDDDSSDSSSSDEKSKKKKKKRKQEKKKPKKSKKKKQSSVSDTESSDVTKMSKRTSKKRKKVKDSKSNKNKKPPTESETDISDDEPIKKKKKSTRNKKDGKMSKHTENKSVSRKRRSDNDSDSDSESKIKKRKYDFDLRTESVSRNYRDEKNSLRINSRDERNSTKKESDIRGLDKGRGGERRDEIRDERWTGESDRRDRSPRRDIRRSPSRKYEEDRRNKRVGLSEEEKAARLAEMTAAGAAREADRGQRVARQRAEDAAEARAPSRGLRNEARVLPDSLEDRIRSNRHYIQRDRLHMNEHFARR